MEQYYYNHMDKQKQAAYHGILQGITSLADEFQIPALDGEDLYNVFFQLRLDHPEIFWATGYKYRYYKDSPNIIFIPEYLFDKGKIKEPQKAMKSRVEKLVRPAQSLSEWEKEKYVHDFICQNVHYDKLKKAYSHEIIGPLGQGVGVCEGIAKAVKVLLDALGVWCVIAICGNNPEKGIKYRHTWNIVRIGGAYYHLDTTFDNTLGKSDKVEDIRYDYFNLDDGHIFKDHEPLIAAAPHCTDHDHFYYKEKKLSFTKTEDVYKRSLQAAKKGKTLTFHWRGGYLTREVLNELLGLIRKAGEEEYNPADYMPTTEKSVDGMYEQLTEFIRHISNPYLKSLLEYFFVNDQEFIKKFRSHSAAKTVHHGFSGGLLEHTLSVLRMCEYFAGSYGILNKDLLLTAAMCHDIGKTRELSSFPDNDYTDEGQLIGHIVIGVEMLDEAIRTIPDFPVRLANELKHCIIAHHGELEYGSPKKPALAEAVALNLADNADAKMQTLTEIFKGKTGTDWLGFNRLFDSNLRRTSGA